MVRSYWRGWFTQQATAVRHTCRKERHRGRWHRPQFECLEDRFAPATHTWTGSVSNLWSAAGNWNGGSPAGDNNAVLIFPAGAPLFTNNDLNNLTIQSIT